MEARNIMPILNQPMTRTVLITGVAGGIGRATATVFAENDWYVIGVDRQAAGEMTDVHNYIEADISDAAESEELFAKVADRVGSLDALVNNAAIQICKPLVDTLPEEWDAVMASNLRSVFLAAKNAYPIMRRGGGAVVNVSSVHAMATSANIAAYAASKGGLLAFTRALAIEWSQDKIRVNSVLPGAIDTPMLHAGLDRGPVYGLNGHKVNGTGHSPAFIRGGEGQDVQTEMAQRVRALGERHVIGRVGHPEEVAEAILFLADGSRSSFVTGHALVVDGGATTRLSTE